MRIKHRPEPSEFLFVCLFDTTCFDTTLWELIWLQNDQKWWRKQPLKPNLSFCLTVFVLHKWDACAGDVTGKHNTVLLLSKNTRLYEVTQVQMESTPTVYVNTCICDGLSVMQYIRFPSFPLLYFTSLLTWLLSEKCFHTCNSSPFKRPMGLRYVSSNDLAMIDYATYTSPRLNVNFDSLKRVIFTQW